MSHHEHPVATQQGHTPGAGHGHSHGLVDPSIARSREGVRVVALALTVLTVTALVETVRPTASRCWPTSCTTPATR